MRERRFRTSTYAGPSLVVAYSHCIAHGYDMAMGPAQQKRAVDAGAWLLYRYDPRRIAKGEAPLILDSPSPRLPLHDYMKQEARFRMVETADPKAPPGAARGGAARGGRATGAVSTAGTVDHAGPARGPGSR